MRRFSCHRRFVVVLPSNFHKTKRFRRPVPEPGRVRISLGGKKETMAVKSLRSRAPPAACSFGRQSEARQQYRFRAPDRNGGHCMRNSVIRPQSVVVGAGSKRCFLTWRARFRCENDPGRFRERRRDFHMLIRLSGKRHLPQAKDYSSSSRKQKQSFMIFGNATAGFRPLLTWPVPLPTLGLQIRFSLIQGDGGAVQCRFPI